MSRDKYISCLLQTFRQHGYDGATLAKISQATGLGKASLYHHFPGGKDEMVTAVLDFLEQCLVTNIIKPLRGSEEPVKRLEKMCAAVRTLYADGHQPCIFAVLLMGSGRDIFQAKVRELLQVWIKEIAIVLQEVGLEKPLCRQRAEEGIIAIQGALILGQALEDPSIFVRVVEQLPQKLCNQ